MPNRAARVAVTLALLSLLFGGAAGAPTTALASGAVPDQLELSPSSFTGTAGSQQCLTAHVTGPNPLLPIFRDAVPNVVVRFGVAGANFASGQGTTDTSGDAGFCYTPSSGGSDTVTAYADADGNGTRAQTEPQDTAAGTIAPPRPAGPPHIFGSDFYGQLGTGKGGVYPTGSGSLPPGVALTWPTAVYQLEAGGGHVLALATDGTVWMAGSTSHGQTGPNVFSAGCNGTFVCNPRPVQATDLAGAKQARITHVAAGGQHSLALGANGTVWAWGSNTAGQLGSNTNQTQCYNGGAYDPCRYGPEEVPGLLETRFIGGAFQPPNTWVRQIAAGGDFSLVVKQGTAANGSDDSVWGWGNVRHYLGALGSTTSSMAPQQLRGLSNVRSVSAGPNYGLAVKWDGTVWFWGSNGETDRPFMGQTPFPDLRTATQIPGLSNIVAAAAGDNHAIVLKGDGTVWAWGVDTAGQIGDNYYEVRNETPVQVGVDPYGNDFPLTGVVAIAAGAEHNLALKSDGTVWAWGRNAEGQVGSSPTSCSPGGNNPYFGCARLPVELPALAGATEIAAGGANSLAIVPDTTPPTTQVSVSPVANPAGWHKSDPTVTFTAADPGGTGVRKIVYSALGGQPIGTTEVSGATAGLTITAEGTTTISYQAVDVAGNAEPLKTVVVRLDKTAPTGVAGAPARQPDGGGWYRSPLQVTFSGADAVSGIDSCTAPVYSGPDGASVAATGSCTDRAGNIAGGTFLLSYDSARPSAQASVSPTPNAVGWNAGPVTVTITASDTAGGSGVQALAYSASGAQTIPTTTATGATVSFGVGAPGVTVVSFAASDVAGNAEVGQNLSIRIDGTPPSIQCAAADGLWHAADVAIACTAADSGSGLANAADASFSLSTTVPPGTETAAAQTGTRSVCDLAANCATAGPVGGNKVDKKAPAITIATPPTATAVYEINQVVPAAYSCADGGSGVATCAGPVASGSAIDTTSVGAKTFGVAATDNVGNASLQTASYTVTYRICALFDQARAYRLRSIVPVRLQLCDAQGANLSAPSLALTAMGLTKIDSSASSALAEDAGSANPDSVFRYDAALGGYIFNLDTASLSTGTWALTFGVQGDPVIHSVRFDVR